MPTVVLTDRTVASARAETGRLELWDLRIPGLCLRVTSRGVKTWIFRYRTPDGRQPRYTIGQVPAFGLKDARVRAAEIDKEVSLGGDPATDRRQARIEVPATPKTFNELADLYFNACESGEWKPKGKRKKDGVIKGEKARLDLHVRPILGERPITSISRPDLKSLLREMVKKGIHAQTNLTQAVVRQIFNYAISEDFVLINPAMGFPRFGEQSPRSRIWSDEELAALWASLDDPAGLFDEEGGVIHISEPLRIAIKLLILLGQRRAEVIGMERAELDLKARTWVVRAQRMKGGRAHLVPLTDEAVALIERAMLLADEERATPSAYVFTTTRREDKAIKPASVTHAMARLRVGLGIEGPTVHDLRRTVSTNLTSERCGVAPFIRSKVLGHIDAGGGAMVSVVHYDANTYVSEKRRALEIWTAVLLAVVNATPG